MSSLTEMERKMDVQTWDEIVCNATVLLDRIDKNGNIFDSSDDTMTNFKIINELNVNKIDILSLLYKIASFKNEE